MNRGYEHVPNRIIAPHTSVILDPPRRNEYEVPRVGRKTLLGSPPTTTRQPLLGDAPTDRSSYYRSSSSYSSVPYNGPVIDLTRRRGFDKGPEGEDLFPRTSTRQPLLRTPKLAVERMGGDMDISRSRSPSPEYRLVNARSVRDDRKKNRPVSRRSRSRSRSRRSRSISSRRSRSRSNPREMVRERGNPKDRSRATYSSPSVAVREGVVWTNENYHDFLNIFLDLLNSEIGKDMHVHGVRKIYELITPASDAEKQRILLPPELHDSDRERMLHCDTSIEGLPASIFFGSGYGTRQHYAKYSAAKDLIDKCHRIGVINSDLHVAISSNRQRIDKSFQHQHIVSISKAVNAVILLIKKMAREVLPVGFMTLRDLEPDIIDKFKYMLRMVMIDVYYQGNEKAVAVVPEALESSYSRSSGGSYRSESPYDHREHGKRGETVQSYTPGYYEPKPKDERRQIDMDKEVDLRVKQELEKKRHEIEQEIRQKLLEEERAKIRAELEMEKRIENMMQEQQKFKIEKERERREQEELQRKQAMTQQVEDDFYDLVAKLEQQFVDVRARGLNNVLDMIFASSTFKTIQVYSATLTSMNFEQKQNLVVDLRQLLETIANAVQANTPAICAVPAPVQLPAMTYKAPTSSRNEQVNSLTVGDMRLRLLTPSEQRRLSKGDKVIAQDMKTGNWNLAVVVKVGDERVTVAVGSAQWKKQWNELYIEDKISSRY